MSWRTILDRIATAYVQGVADVIYIVVLFLILLPYMVKQSLGPYAEHALPQGGLPEYWWFSVGILVGLSSAARALRGTIYSPVFRGAASLFAFILFLAFMDGRTTVSVEGVDLGQATMSFSLDLSPLIFAAAVFLLLPSIVSPLLQFFLTELVEE